MDDWNDFGDLAPSNSHPFLSSPNAPYADSPSNSTLDTFSDSAATFLDQNTASQSSSQHQPHSHAEMTTSHTLPAPRSVRFSSFPFLQSVRQRRADRAAAAAAAATAAAAAHAANTRNSNAPSTVPDTDVDEYGRMAPFDVENDPVAPAVSEAPRNENEISAADANRPETPDDTLAQPSWPIDTPSFADNHAAEGAGDEMSSASEEDSVEPRSVMMPITNRRLAANPLGEDLPDSPAPEDDNLRDGANAKNSLLGYSPRCGDLDNVPDDYELNIEGFRFTAAKSANSASEGDLEPASSVIPSSLLKYLEKSYIKLEVISAKQIRGLLLFFNVFAFISIIYTLVLVVLFNTTFKRDLSVPLPLKFVPKSLQRENVLQPCYIVTGGNPFAIPCSLISPGAPHIGFRQVQSPVPLSRPPACSNLFHAKTDKELAGKQLLAASGIYLLNGGVQMGQKCPLPRNSSLYSLTPQNVLTPMQESLPKLPTFPANAQFGKFVELRSTLLPLKYRIAHHSIASALGVFFLFLSILFFIRLWVAKRRNITHEQVWAFILILATGLYFNPLENTVDIVDAVRVLTGKSDGAPFPEVWVRISNFLSVVRDASFMTFIYFYLWANFHSYRILDSTQRLRFVSFYLPKLLVLVPLLAFHIVTYIVIELRFSGVPLLSGPAFGYIIAPFQFWNYATFEFWLCVVRSCLDLIALVLMFREGLMTTKALQQAPYMKYRTKRVGFRFFIYINAVFYLLFYILYIITFFGKPPGDSVVFFSESSFQPQAGLPFFFAAGSWALITGYVLSTAYVHLPYTCTGWFLGWFRSVPLGPSGSRWSFPSSNSEGQSSQKKDVIVTDIRSRVVDSVDKVSGKSPSHTWSYDDETPKSLVDNDAELQQQIIEPITYRKRESKDSLELKANCFTMQTHVIMFNFAWYVYYYGTPKLENFRPKENPLPFQFVVDKHVKSSETDTQALILNCTDRIIITFKGTTSMQNLKTSLQLSFEHLHSVVRLNADGEDEFGRLKKLFGSRYMSGKIHRGFATAYKSVMDEVVSRVRSLRQEKPRPVFLTGHSLGGALATICSLDLWVKLNISRREIFVSTFGSPRVGNSDFAAVYREVVPLHWRIVVAPDMIAKLPRVGYTHVGKKVVLTPQGDMLIDPNALEHRPWTGEAAGFAYHRKASYLLAMRAWCVRNHGLTYTPVFWPFPVRPEDERRFAGAFDPEEDYDDGGGGRKVAEKIIRLDAMVDALGGEDHGLDNMAVVEKWARLTRRALLNEKLGGATNG